MRTIYKYPLQVQDEQVLNLRGSVLSAGVQGDNIVIWAIHDYDNPAMPMRISVRGTGHELNGEEGRFINTLFLGPLVFHVFAVLA